MLQRLTQARATHAAVEEDLPFPPFPAAYVREPAVIRTRGRLFPWGNHVDARLMSFLYAGVQGHVSRRSCRVGSRTWAGRVRRVRGAERPGKRKKWVGFCEQRPPHTPNPDVAPLLAPPHTILQPASEGDPVFSPPPMRAAPPALCATPHTPPPPTSAVLHKPPSDRTARIKELFVVGVVEDVDDNDGAAAASGGNGIAKEMGGGGC
ncbi:hypothetical protein K438DRAFT_1777626 [Mycena galopus ATCC 62051]|nr:hypothetical protein K438DRAFT_1777626 [Mycena galopus ATCC 62051]